VRVKLIDHRLEFIGFVGAKIATFGCKKADRIVTLII
jgi:hypothetical protein